jgi:hypothetical protein
MPDSSRSPGAPVTDFLRAWSGGGREALDAVISLVYAETIGRDWKFARAWLQRELTR